MRWRSNYHLAKLSQSVLHNLNGEMRPTQGPDRGKATTLLSTSFRVINVESGYSCASFAKSSHIKLACPKVAHLGHCFLPAAMPLPTSEHGTCIFLFNMCECSDQRVQQLKWAIQRLKRGPPSSNCNLQSCNARCSTALSRRGLGHQLLLEVTLLPDSPATCWYERCSRICRKCSETAARTTPAMVTKV